MLESSQGFVTVAWYREVYLVFGVVEIQCNSAVFLALPVFVYYVEFLENLDQVVGVFLANVFDPKVIDDETETDGSSVMFPEP